MHQSRWFAVAMMSALVALLGTTPAAVGAATPAPAEIATAPQPRALTSLSGIHHAESLPSAALTAVTGTKDWVILRCKYQSQWGNKPRIQADASNTGFFETMWSSTVPGLQHYWNQASYGLMSVTHTTPGVAGAAGWRNMPSANNAYGTQANADADINITAANDTLAGDCATAWDDSVTFDSNRFYAFVLDQKIGEGAAGAGGVFWFGSHDGVFNVNGVIMSGSFSDDEAGWAHEIGHAFGLMHTENTDGIYYGDDYDIMSAPSGACGTIWDNNIGIPPDAQTARAYEYGCIPGQPMAYHKAKVLGWIPANRQYKHQGGTTTITLERLAAPVSASNYLYAEIPIDGSSYYTVEARMKTGISDTLVTGYDENILHNQNDSTCCYYAGQTPPQGFIVINKFSSDVNGLHLRLQGSDNYGRQWDPGETFNGVNGIKVEVLSQQQTSLTVRITSQGVSGSRYYPLPRQRILDTQTSLGGHLGKLGKLKSMKLQVTGVGGIPSTGVGAVVLNLRGLAPTAKTSITAWTAGLSRPGTANLQLMANRTSSNLITIKPSAAGQISLFNKAGTTHLIADVIGYYGSANAGLGYNAVYPFSPTVGAISTVPANGSVDIQVAGTGSVPGSGATVVALQVESQAGSAGGALTVYPKGAARPSQDDFTYAANGLHTQMALVPVGTSNSITVYNTGSATTYVYLEVLGWFGSSGGLSFHPTAPARVRSSIVNAGATSTLDLTGVGGIPASGPLAVLTNFSALAPAGASYFDVRPADENYNYGGHDMSFIQVDANAVIANVADATGNITIKNLYSNVTIAIDVFGWFGN